MIRTEDAFASLSDSQCSSVDLGRDGAFVSLSSSLKIPSRWYWWSRVIRVSACRIPDIWDQLNRSKSDLTGQYHRTQSIQRFDRCSNNDNTIREILRINL